MRQMGMQQKIRRLRLAFDVLGPGGLARAVHERGHPVPIASDVRAAVTNARVLEVGGPSDVFQSWGLVPVYPYAAVVDNVNYAGATLWESGLRDGGRYTPDGPKGTQYLREAARLDGLDGYDVVVSSHTIEHTANPLAALRAWRKMADRMVMVLPHCSATFDHRRPLTTLDHLRADEQAETGEDDTPHAAEILALHDLQRDPDCPSRDELHRRVAENLATRAMHHHVFDTRSAVAMVAEAGWVPVAAEANWPHDIVVVAQNGPAHGPARLRSDFLADRA
jgi:hypothetical protein